MRFKYIFIPILFLSILISSLPVHAAEPSGSPDLSWPDGPQINSEAAVVMELSTGTVLYEKNATKAEYPASITKIMTSLLAVEICSMDEVFTFSDTAVYGNGTNSSSIGMNVGEKLSMENCMYGMMLASANEVAKAIGEHISGDLDSFVDLMNKRAKELGAVNTHFANPNGLYDENHYTCAYDMALIAAAAAKNPTFRKVAGTRVYVIPPTEMTDEDRWVANTHQLINPSKHPQYGLSDCYAGKTGFTDESRYTLVSLCKRGNLDIVCVVMRAPKQADQYEDSLNLIEYAFENFSMAPISKLDSAPSFDNYSLFTKFSPLFDMKNAPLSIDTTSAIVLPNGASYSDVVSTITYDKLETINLGTNIIGSISYSYHGKEVGKTDILYESSESFSINTITEEEITDISEGAEGTDTEKKPKFNKVIIIIIVIIAVILIILGFLYFYFIELPHRRKRRLYYEKRRKRIEKSDYIDI